MTTHVAMTIYDEFGIVKRGSTQRALQQLRRNVDNTMGCVRELPEMP